MRSPRLVHSDWHRSTTNHILDYDSYVHLELRYLPACLPPTKRVDAGAHELGLTRASESRLVRTAHVHNTISHGADMRSDGAFNRAHTQIGREGDMGPPEATSRAQTSKPTLKEHHDSRLAFCIELKGRCHQSHTLLAAVCPCLLRAMCRRSSTAASRCCLAPSRQTPEAARNRSNCYPENKVLALQKVSCRAAVQLGRAYLHQPRVM